MEQALATALEPAKAAWNQLLADVARECGADSHEWKSYSPKTGWALRVKRKQRTIVWLSPSTGCFSVLFILGGKAVQAARQIGLPTRVLTRLNQAPKYPEGTGLRLVVKTSKELGIVKTLAQLKLNA